MDLRTLTDAFAVAPQITIEDMPALKAAGFTTVVCNRPDAEVTADLSAAAVKAAVEAHGMVFIDNPVDPSGMTAENIAVQRQALAEAKGPVFAYCRSGTRSAIAWALAMAGTTPIDELISAAARAGYDLGPHRARLQAIAAG